MKRQPLYTGKHAQSAEAALFFRTDTEGQTAPLPEHFIFPVKIFFFPATIFLGHPYR